MTLKYEWLKKGLEPDKSYYVRHAARMRDKFDTFDWQIEPPPDLVIEVDVTHAAVNREAIYAAMKVPEMWKLEDEKLAAYKLVSGKWKAIKKSLAFPFLTVTDLNPFLLAARKTGELKLMREVRAWAAGLRR